MLPWRAATVLLLLSTAGLCLAQQEMQLQQGQQEQQQLDAGEQWAQMTNAARAAENSLGQLTLSFFRQISNGTGGLDGKQMLAASNALNSIKQQAANSGLLNLNWGNLAETVQAFQNIDTSPAFLTPDPIRGGVKLAASVYVNELATPGARIVERAQQLGQIWTDITSGSEACGAYTFNPGGAPVNAKWVGPTFTLTQTTGNCVVRTEVAGEGNTRWTRLQESLVCLGPSTQWSWTPLTYKGVTRERTSMEGPECKTQVKLGTEATITLYGGDSKDKIVFKSEKEFYAAMVVNKTFDFKVMPLKTAMKNFQVKLDYGAQKWHDALYTEVDAAASEGIASMTGADLAARVTKRYQQLQQNMGAASNFANKWTNADGSFKPGAYMQQLTSKIASGKMLMQGVGRSLFPKSS